MKAAETQKLKEKLMEEMRQVQLTISKLNTVLPENCKLDSDQLSIGSAGQLAKLLNSTRRSEDETNFGNNKRRDLAELSPEISSYLESPKKERVSDTDSFFSGFDAKPKFNFNQSRIDHIKEESLMEEKEEELTKLLQLQMLGLDQFHFETTGDLQKKRTKKKGSVHKIMS